jgi:hypothetical protein
LEDALPALVLLTRGARSAFAPPLPQVVHWRLAHRGNARGTPGHAGFVAPRLHGARSQQRCNLILVGKFHTSNEKMPTGGKQAPVVPVPGRCRTSPRAPPVPGIGSCRAAPHSPAGGDGSAHKAVPLM